MNSTDQNPPQLLPTAALVSLLVLALAATGLFALSYTNAKSSAALARLGSIHTAQVAAVEAQVNFKTQVQERKNILLRGRDPADYKSYLDRFAQSEASVRAELAAAQDELGRLGLDRSAATLRLAAHAALGRS